MSSLGILTHEKKKELESFHQNFSHHSTVATVVTVVAAFLAILSAIVLTCSGLCLTLPGINAMHDIILPVMIPSTIALLCSIPFMVFSFLHTKKKNQIHDERIGKIQELFSDYHLESYSKENKVQFIYDNLIDPQWNHLYSFQIVDSLKEIYTPKDKSQQTADGEGFR
jgi:hypothetical protein